MTDESIFAEALNIADVTERLRFLDRVCAGNAKLRREVEQLLAAASMAGSFLDKPAAEVTGDFTSAPDATGNFTPSGRHLKQGSAATDHLGTVIAGRYRLVEVIGEGGMGVVYLAVQSEPVKRQVALKLIKSGMDSKTILARFDAERQALALMGHPNIARVYDGGTTPTGHPYFVMELVQGEPLTEYCDQHRLSVDGRLQLFVAVCQAVQHAHQKGIIHRDLKPGNVLVTEVDGRPTPKIIDFGVAKATEMKLTEQSFADLGAVVGTPAYMSPEQADPTSMDIDTRTDVYALGVILYEMLVGSPPIDTRDFKRGLVLEMLRMVREVDPPRPSTKLSTAEALPNIAANRSIEPAKLSKLLQGELDWVVMKAIEKDRTRRYDTANGLAQDIQRYLADEVVEARPPSTAYRMRKFVRRHKGQVIAASLVFLALVGGIVGTSIGLVRAERARDAEALRVSERDEALGIADTRADERDKVNKELKRQLANGNFLFAKASYDNRDVLAAAERLAKIPPDERGWEWSYLSGLVQGGIFTLHGHAHTVWSVCFSPDGSKIVTGSEDHTAKVWDARTGEQLFELNGHGDVVQSVAFSADGTRIVTGSRDKTAKVWDARTGLHLLDFKGHTGDIWCVSFSNDGTRIATAGLDGLAKVWDARTGNSLLDLKHKKGILCVAFSPEGTRVATGGGDQTVKVWDARSGMQSLNIEGHHSVVQGVAFSPDGRRIVSGGFDKTVKVWDAVTGVMQLDFKGLPDWILCVAFSPDGSRIAAASYDKTAKVWDARTGRHLFDLKGHTDFVVGVGFSPDGTRIVTGSWDKTAKVWDARTGAPRIELKGHTGGIASAGFSPDGTRIVTASRDKSAKVWDARTGDPLFDLPTQGASSAAFSPDGSRIATGCWDKTAKVWDARNGALLIELKGHAEAVTKVAFSPDGTRIVTGSRDKSARIWDAGNGNRLYDLIGHTDHVQSVCFSPDGSRIVTCGKDNSAKVWDSKTGSRLFDLPHAVELECVAFSPDGSRIITGGGDLDIPPVIKMWDAWNGTHLLDIKGHTGVIVGIGYSPDGARIVSSSTDGELDNPGEVKVWDARTGTPLLDLKGHARGVYGVAFSPDGTRIVTCSEDETAAVWEARGIGPMDAAERERRLLRTRPDYWHHLEGCQAALRAKDSFAVRFHSDRILAMPEHRTTAQFTERNAFLADPLVIARTGFHHPALATAPYDRGILTLRAIQGDRLARRLVAQQLLRDGKPAPAVPLLFVSLSTRSPAAPPVEELLLAKAFLDLKRPDEAMRFHLLAIEWLDKPRDPKAKHATGYASNGDPRRNPFDWEAWHECDVFREEVEKALKAKQE